MTINYATLQNTLFPAGTSTPQTLRKSADGVLFSYGKEVPIDGASGYAVGCIFIHMNGSNEEVLYTNEGTATSADFNSISKKSIANAYGTAAGRGPSPEVWDNCPVLDILLDPTVGWIHFYDFQNGPEIASNTSVEVDIASGYTVYSETGATATQQLDAPEGELLLEVNGTDDIDIAIGWGEKAGQIMIASSGPKAFWFEARIKMATVADNKTGAFIGFHDEACFVADGILADEGAMTTDDYLGFLWVATDNDTIDTVCELAAGAMEKIKDTVAVPVSGAYIKLGMKLITGETNVRFFVDGVEAADKVSVTNAKFPFNEEMQPVFAVRSYAADSPAGGVSIDWWRIAQLY
jgi:hypothetical protein